ncbi:MAG: alpha/beta hydrolase [Candidatus Dormiibacterota bacterium]
MSQLLTLAPPGRVVLVPDRGEMFIRDSGPESDRNGTVLLLHGWMFGGDLNWLTCFGPLMDAGYRVVSVDHRGHGRGIRSRRPFRLADCADDCAGLLQTIGVEQATIVGYSMGGAIAQIFAHRYPELTAGLVLSATTDQWREDRRMRMGWRAIRLLEFMLTHSQRRVWHSILRRNGRTDTSDEILDWIIGELERNDPKAIAEAGREMARFDSRPWVAEITAPAAVIKPRRDQLVPPWFQEQLARDIPGARLFQVEGDHTVVGMHPERYVPVLLEAIADVRSRATDAGTAVVA